MNGKQSKRLRKQSNGDPRLYKLLKKLYYIKRSPWLTDPSYKLDPSQAIASTIRES